MPKVIVLPGRAIYHGGSLCKEGSCVEVADETAGKLVADGAVEISKPKAKPKPKAKAKAKAKKTE